MKRFMAGTLAVLLTGCVAASVEDPSGKAGGDTTYVCHKGKKTLELPQEAIDAHLDHGDRIGPC